MTLYMYNYLVFGKCRFEIPIYLNVVMSLYMYNYLVFGKCRFEIYLGLV